MHRTEQYYRLRIMDWDTPFRPAIGVAMQPSWLLAIPQAMQRHTGCQMAVDFETCQNQSGAKARPKKRAQSRSMYSADEIIRYRQRRRFLAVSTEILEPHVAVMVNDFGRNNLSFDPHRRIHRHCGLGFRPQAQHEISQDARIPLDDGKS